MALAEGRRVSSDVDLIVGLTATIPTSTTATSASPAAVAATTTTAEAGHLGEAGINLLLGLLQDVDEFTGLLLVWSIVVSDLSESVFEGE